MTEKDTITLPRKVVEKAAESLEWAGCGAGGGDCYEEAAKALRTALAAPRLEVTVDPRLTAEEAAAISAALAAEQPKPDPLAYFDLQKQVFYWARPTMIDVPMTIALEPLPLYAAPPDIEALRRDAERYRWGVENARWVRHEHEAYVAIPVAVDADLSCTPMRTAAIDAAMKEGT